MQENNNEEIDLGDLFRLLKKGLLKIGQLFLMLFLFLKKNAIAIVILIVVVGAIGFFIDRSKNVFTESSVTLQSFYHSQDYLYKTINEINWEIENKTEELADEMNMHPDSLELYSLSIKPLERVTELTKEEKEYITLLKEEGSYTPEDIMKIVLRSSNSHKLKIKHPKDSDANIFFNQIEKKLLDNSSYAEIHETELKNIHESIDSYKKSIAQVDAILNAYASKLSEKVNSQVSFYNSESNLDIGNISTQKKELRKSINLLESKLSRQKNFITPVDRAKTAENEEAAFTKEIITLPIIFLVLFFGIKFIIYLNKKATQYAKEK